MDTDNLSNAKESLTDAAMSASDKKLLADSSHVPFLIRSWWLREFEPSDEFKWPEYLIGDSVWSKYSDPMCDVGGIADFVDF